MVEKEQVVPCLNALFQEAAEDWLVATDQVHTPSPSILILLYSLLSFVPAYQHTQPSEVLADD